MVEGSWQHPPCITDFFKSLLLSFSPALDEHNPDIPEWREDVGRVVRTAVSQVQEEIPSGTTVNMRLSRNVFYGLNHFKTGDMMRITSFNVTY